MSGYNKRKSRSSGSSGSSRSGSGSGRSGSFPRSGSGASSRVVPPLINPSDSLGSHGPLGQGFGSSIPTFSPGSDFVNPASGLGSDTNAAAISRLLESLQKGQNPLQNLLMLTGGQGWDNELWSMFLQFALQQSANSDQRTYDQLLTKDQREYDWNLLQDSRIYNDPTNQLARLLGSGISRDAAIQILSGSAGGSGVGSSGAPVSNSASSVGSPSGTPGDQKIKIANTAMQGVQLVANLVNQGVDMFTAINQAKLYQSQAFMSQSQMQAYQGVNDITQAFNNAVFDGTLSVEDLQGLRTADDYYRYITDHADTNLVKPLINSGSVSRAFGSTVGREMLNNHLEQTRLSRDSDTLFNEYVRSQQLSNALQSVSVEKVGAEMSLIGTQKRLGEQQIVESCNRVCVGEAQIEVLNKQGKWIQIQGDQLIKKTESEVNLMDTQAYGADINNKQLLLNYEYNSAGFPMLKLSRIHELEVELQRWQCVTSPSSLQTMVQKWLLDPQNALDAAYLQTLRNQAVGDFASYYPTLWQLSNGFNAAGVNDFVRTTTNSGLGLFNAVRAFTPMP